MIHLALIAVLFFLNVGLNRCAFLSRRQRKIWFVCFSFLLIFVLYAFRDSSVGVDTENYLEKYKLISSHSFGEIISAFYCERVEVGYALMNKCLSFVSRNPNIILIINAMIICCGLAHFIVNYVDDEMTAIIVYLCCGLHFYSMNIMRQMIAVTLLLNAWLLLTKQKYKTSLVLYLVSITFHISAACFALVYLFYFIRRNRWLTAVALMIGVIIALNYRVIIQAVADIIGHYRFADNNTRTTAKGIFVVWLIEGAFAVLLLCYYFFRTKLSRVICAQEMCLSEIQSMCIPVFVLLYIALSFMGSQYGYMDRFGIYFLPFIIPMFVDIGSVFQKKSLLLSRIYVVGLRICFIMLFCLDAFASHHAYYFH